MQNPPNPREKRLVALMQETLQADVDEYNAGDDDDENRFIGFEGMLNLPNPIPGGRRNMTCRFPVSRARAQR